MASDGGRVTRFPSSSGRCSLWPGSKVSCSGACCGSPLPGVGRVSPAVMRLPSARGGLHESGCGRRSPLPRVGSVSPAVTRLLCARGGRCEPSHDVAPLCLGWVV